MSTYRATVIPDGASVEAALLRAQTSIQPAGMGDYARVTGPQSFDGEHRFLDGIIIQSADGTIWDITVSDAGALVIAEHGT